MNEIQVLNEKITKLQNDLLNLQADFYRNNFTANQDFQKYSDFKTMLKLPSYSSRPATCQVGEIIESGGKAYICSASNTWTVIGTQS